MSLRHKQQRRLRYYRGNLPLLIKWGRELEYHLCSFMDVACDHCCDSYKTKKRHIFCHRSGGEEPESSYVCANCMPDFYRRRMAEWFFYGTRKFERLWRAQERQHQIERHQRWHYGPWVRIKK